MEYVFAMGVEQVLTKYQVNKLQTWAAWPVFQVKEPKRLKLPASQVTPSYGNDLPCAGWRHVGSKFLLALSVISVYEILMSQCFMALGYH